MSEKQKFEMMSFKSVKELMANIKEYKPANINVTEEEMALRAKLLLTINKVSANAEVTILFSERFVEIDAY